MTRHQLNTWWQRVRSDRGSDAVEMAVTIPLWLVFFGVAIAGGRIVTADHSVEAAAADAARSASISRTASAARTDGLNTAKASLSNQGLNCRSIHVSISTSEFAKPAGQPAKVTATVSCTVTLGDITAVSVLPGSYTVTKTISSPIDTYRERR